MKKITICILLLSSLSISRPLMLNIISSKEMEHVNFFENKKIFKIKDSSPNLSDSLVIKKNPLEISFFFNRLPSLSTILALVPKLNFAPHYQNESYVDIATADIRRNSEKSSKDIETVSQTRSFLSIYETSYLMPNLDFGFTINKNF